MKPILLDFTDHEKATALFDEAFQHHRRKYIIQPIDRTIAQQWLRDHAYMRNFGWGSEPKSPMKYGDLISLDELYYRNRCGWVTNGTEGDNNGYLCDAPPDKDSKTCTITGKRLCHTWQCPISRSADLIDLKRLDRHLWREYRDAEDESEIDEWRILDVRPRYAYVANIQVLDCDY